MINTEDYMATIACRACLERAECEAQEGMVFTTMEHRSMMCEYCGSMKNTIHLRFCQPKGYKW